MFLKYISVYICYTCFIYIYIERDRYIGICNSKFKNIPEKADFLKSLIAILSERLSMLKCIIYL